MQTWSFVDEFLSCQFRSASSYSTFFLLACMFVILGSDNVSHSLSIILATQKRGEKSKQM